MINKGNKIQEIAYLYRIINYKYYYIKIIRKGGVKIWKIEI